MLLAHASPDPQLNLALDTFLQMMQGLFGPRLVSVCLHGSIVFGDLAPGYGDLDFLVVVEGGLSDDERHRLVALRREMQGGDLGMYARMLEGAFLPRRMLDPAVAGRGFWWGTSGERPWETNRLGWLVLHVIRERGLVLWGEDVRPAIPVASRTDLAQALRSACRSGREHGRGGGLHAVDWLLTAARLLLWVREGRLSSKSEAAEWGAAHAVGAWRALLPQAARVRREPSLAERPEVRAWLQGLTGPIQEAYDEVEAVLADQPSGPAALPDPPSAPRAPTA